MYTYKFLNKQIQPLYLSPNFYNYDEVFSITGRIPKEAKILKAQKYRNYFTNFRIKEYKRKIDLLFHGTPNKGIPPELNDKDKDIFLKNVEKILNDEYIYDMHPFAVHTGLFMRNLPIGGNFEIINDIAKNVLISFYRQYTK